MEENKSNNVSSISLCESDNDSLINEKTKHAFEKSVWNQKVKSFREQLCKELSIRHQKMIENYIDSELGSCDERGDVLVNEIRNGRVSFAYEGMTNFPTHIVEVLRFDITHLDLSMNDIRNFDFLRGFKNLKSLIVDGNSSMDIESLPKMENLELFYANKCEIQFPRSFIFRVAIIFSSLKYFSMMDNPVCKRNTCDDAWEGRAHRIRMLAVFINPQLVHFNDRQIKEQERMHSKIYHHYLGPKDSELTKFKGSVDTDDIRKILPFDIHDKALELLTYEDRERSDDIDEGLADVKISAYFASQENEDISIARFFEQFFKYSGESR